MKKELRDYILEKAKEIFLSQIDEPLTQSELEEIMLDFSEKLLGKFVILLK